MNWIFDHLQLIIAAAGAIAWWLNKNRSDAAEEAPPKEATFEDAELAERTRRIREEIQRKIADRASGYPTEQPSPARTEPAEPPPVIREVVAAEAGPAPRRGNAETRQHAEILEQQAALAEKLRELAAMKTAMERRTEFENATADHTVEARTRARSSLLDDLRSPDALRRAFILREVLGPPVALRR